MSASIKKNVITITQGDTLDTTLKLYTSDDEEYIPSEGDVIRFACKASYKDSTPLIYKVIPNSTLQLRLESEETKKLTARAKPYVYDIQITFADGTVNTFISSYLYSTQEVE